LSGKSGVSERADGRQQGEMNVKLCKHLGADTYLPMGARDYLTDDEVFLASMRLEFRRTRTRRIRSSSGIRTVLVGGGFALQRRCGGSAYPFDESRS
jgi:hypothetical protein